MDMLLDPLLDSIEIVWVPASDAQSSTFNHFFARSARFEWINAVGVHLQVKVKNGIYSDIDSKMHQRVEENVRGVLQRALPSLEVLSSLSKGFLAKSLCDFHTWKTSNPLEEILNGTTAEAPSLCFSSSFPLKHESDSFYNKIIRGGKGESIDNEFSVVERALYETKRSFRTAPKEHKLTVVRFGRGSASPDITEVEYLEAWIARPSDTKESWDAVIPVGEAERNVLVVTAIAQERDLETLECIWLRRDGKRVAPASLPFVEEIQVPETTAAASIKTNISGEGFHRRYTVDVTISGPENCGGEPEGRTILVRVPISSTAYIDLDEIRRVERFNEVKLLSFAKHIEIERPSPVSSQHVVGLEFTMLSNNQAHIEFPIHFRYQAPSESDLYRQASVIAPDIFLLCRGGSSSANKTKLSSDGVMQSYLQDWGLSSQTPSHSGSHWLRLVTTFPLPVAVVLTPVGYLPSDWLVSSVTLLCASMGAALLLLVSIKRGKRGQSSTKAN
ncbi:hypothetical protein P3T76_001180 [Phytophthora citrophthora]|uniref:Phosphatidylinositol-glycan biosynthesis class X protein n=1 Tax=Phytophthora citrophthora TaxID=4793 RepID=A0AAD9GY22_9STRA|nr:hypothetical protein P3T76_001180 [Phytophthora citrophthora]